MPQIAKLPINPVVRVTMPAKLAHDLKGFQKIQAKVLDHLGCTACCSGFDIRWDVSHSLRVDEKFNIHEM